MLKRFDRRLSLIVWPVAAAIAWLVLVPELVSTMTFVGMNLIVLFALIFAGVIWRGTRPTGSVAQLLHDVEHDLRPPR